MNSRPLAVVTGGAGFIGSHMVDLLVDQGFRVHVIDSLIGGRAANLAQHQANPDVVLDERDVRALASHDKVFTNVKFVFHYRRHRRHRAIHRAADRIYVGQCSGDRAGAGSSSSCTSAKGGICRLFFLLRLSSRSYRGKPSRRTAVSVCP